MQPAGKLHLPSLAQLAVSGAGFVVSLTAAFGLGLAGLVGLASEGTAGGGAYAAFSAAWVSALVAFLLLPSALLALLRLTGWENPLPPLPWLRLLPAVLMLAWPAALLVGAAASQQPIAALLVLPFLQLFIIGLPVWRLVEFGRRGLPALSARRQWGLLSAALVVGMPLTILIEAVALVGVLAGIFLWAASRPDLLAVLQNLADPALPIDQTLENLLPLLRQPLALLAAAGLVSVLVPLVEEAMKTLAVWLLAPSRPAPHTGFSAGLLCGGAFALVESLGMTANDPGAAWLVLVVGRLGTCVLHVVTGGLVGWGLASAWRGQVWRLAGVFLLSVAIHGTWNLFGAASGLAPLLPGSTLPRWLAQAALFVLPALAATLCLILFGINRRLRLQLGAGSQPS